MFISRPPKIWRSSWMTVIEGFHAGPDWDINSALASWPRPAHHNRREPNIEDLQAHNASRQWCVVAVSGIIAYNIFARSFRGALLPWRRVFSPTCLSHFAYPQFCCQTVHVFILSLCHLNIIVTVTVVLHVKPTHGYPMHSIVIT